MRVRIVNRHGVTYRAAHHPPGTELSMREHVADTLIRLGWVERVDDTSGTLPEEPGEDAVEVEPDDE